MKRTTVLLFLVAALVPQVASAAWDPAGNPVVVAPAAQSQFAVIPFGSGGILAAWVDQRAGDPGDIYAMALDASGDPAGGWPSGGVPICTAAGEQSHLTIVSDQAGGAYLRWIDRRSGTPAHALQRITSTGAIAAGWPVDGLIFAAGPIEDAPYALAPDGAGGAYVAWEGDNPDRARVVRYEGTAVIAPGWPVDLPMSSASPQVFGMIADGAGGIVAVGNSLGDQAVIRISGDGTVSPGWPASGLSVFPESPLGYRLVAGQADGFFATYIPPGPLCPCCEPSGILVKHVGLDGVIDPSWPPGGEQGGLLEEVTADGSGGILSVGAPVMSCTQVAHGLAMRLGADRSHPWDPTPTPICDQPNDQRTPSIAPDGSGGAFIGWLDYRVDHVTPVLYATRLDGAGDFAFGWPPSGSMEAVGAVGPSDPHVVATQPGTAVVVWVDQRNGTADIYAKEMVPGPAGPPATVGINEPGGTTFGISWISPNPARGPVTVMLNLPGTSSGRLDVVDVTGRVCERRALSAGRTTVTLAAGVRPGVYWLRATQGRNLATRCFVIAR